MRGLKHSYAYLIKRDHRTVQWLKYKLWGPGTLKKLVPYCKLRGSPLNLLVPLTAVWAWERSPAIFWGPGTAFPLTLTTATVWNSLQY